MTDLILKSLDVKNFRSIRGQVHAPLDAKVVVVHGENGSGKTSLLSALEFALTGRVQSLERVDPDYEKQLLHRSAVEGSVLLKTLSGTTEQSFKAGLNAGGAHSIVSLDERDATFFRERAFLPQSLLGQLLQIYQDAGNHADSPLAQFVGRLLGLDRLDAIEAGLKPFADVRNVRKNVDGWLAAENEKARLDLLLMDQRKTYGDLNLEVRATFEELVTLCAALELSAKVKEETLDEVASALADGSDSDSFSRLTDQQRRLASIRREIDAALSATKSEVANTSAGSDGASQAFARWQAEYGLRVSALRDRAGGLLPDVSMPSDPAEFAQSVLPRLRTELRQVSERVAQARADIARHAVAQDERNVALRQRDMIARLSTSAGSFGSALAEVTSFITNDICPVCDQDFNEVSKVPLSQHVHLKVMTLSASAERLLTLGRTRSEVQVTIERLDREIEAVATRRIDLEAVADFDRRLASIEALTKEVETLANALREGGRLRAADIAERRVVNEAQARHATLATAHDTLSDFGLSIGAPPIGEGESFQAALARLEALLSARAVRLEERLLRRRNGTDKISTIRSALARRQEVAARISVDSAAWQRADQGLQRAQALRDQGNAIRNAVDRVRSAIVRREFNDRLNRVWRDLFVRLAPTEPFVPAFRIPESFTQRLQPKLITEHWDGGETGGTPGAMLSAGNLNTAALTLFIALHLSVPKDLPWLILDDPVQSMDDVHIAHFAALLRTLSKEHCRQVVIAVHDRQLFEYLKLELSPAFLEDSLLTLELSHGPRRDSVCLSKRFSFKEETAVLAA